MATERLVSVQVLRAAAAGAVVFAHLWPDFAAHGASDQFPNFILGAAGVDLFFVISGFVMAYTAEPLFRQNGAPAAFLTRRLIRIVPLYWLATTGVLVTYLFTAPNLSAHNLTWSNVAGSYLFIPLERPDGTAAPILGVGWTLNFEMFFYVIFAAATLLPRRLAVLAVTTFFVIAINLPIAWPYPFRAWFVSTVYEFALGMWIALAYREGWRIPRWLSALLIAAGLALMVRTDWDGFATISRVIGWGGGATLILAACVLANVKATEASLWLALAFLGDASYALYLLHTFALRAIFDGGSRFLAPATYVWPYAAAGILASLVLAIVAYVAFERPTTSFIKRGMRRKPTIIALASNSPG